LNDLISKAHRILGAFILGGSADALGWRNESASRNAHRKPLSKLEGWSKRIGRVGGYWDRIDPGEYSDDTQLTLAVARCVSPHGEYDADRFVKIELPYWLAYERGGGRTVRSAAKNALKNPDVSWDTNIFEGYYQSGANGAAMRIFPLATIPDISETVRAVWQNALSTHGHSRAIVSALLMAFSLHELLWIENYSPQLYKMNIMEFLSRLQPPEDRRVQDWIEQAGREKFVGSFRHTCEEMQSFMDLAFTSENSDAERVLEQLGCYNSQTRGSGTATVAAAHYFFFKHYDDPLGAIFESANALGTDTDTIAKLCGDLLGCIHGRVAYENQFTESVKNRFYFLSMARYLIGKEVPHWTLVQKEETDLAEPRKEGDEYYSCVFGPGLIVKVRPPFAIRKGTAVVHQVKAQFQCGLTSVFSKTIPTEQHNQNRQLWEDNVDLGVDDEESKA